MQDEKLMMVFNFYKKRKAISTVIGAFFFLVIMAGAFTAFILMMETNSKFLNTQLGASQNEIQKIQEKFVVSACTQSEDDNRLDVFVENTGTVPVEIADLFVINKTMSTKAVKQFDINFNDAFVPGGQTKNITASQPMFMVSTPHTYDIKVVSTSGNSEIISLPVAGPGPDDRLEVKTFTDPPLIVNSGNVTVFMHVFNRGNHTLYDVRPIADFTVTPESVTVVDVTQIGPMSIKRLEPTESTFFQWQYKLFGGVGTKVFFEGGAEAKLCELTENHDVKSAEVSTLVKINEDTPITTAGPSETFVKPRLFFSAPSPFGQAKDKFGYFGVAIVNPTNQSMIVRQVALNIQAPKDSNVVGAVTDASQAASIPTSGWSNPITNVYLWKDNTGITIPAHSTKAWRIAVVGAQPTPADTELPANLLVINAHTTFGQFSNTGKITAVTGTNNAIFNIYQTDSDAGNRRLYNFTNLEGGVPQRFNVTIENTGAANIDSGTKLLTNIPAGFLGVDPTLFSVSGNFNLPTASDVRTFDDGSIQITTTISAAITAGNKATFSFVAIPPVTEEAHMYIMFHFAAGTTAGSGTQAGAFSEIVVHVCGSLTCD